MHVQTNLKRANLLHPHSYKLSIYMVTKETKGLLLVLFSLIYIQTMKKQSLYLDNDDSVIETSGTALVLIFLLTEVFQ